MTAPEAPETAERAQTSRPPGSVLSRPSVCGDVCSSGQPQNFRTLLGGV